MHDANTTREQLIAENTALRQRIAVLEAAQAVHTQTAEVLRDNERRYRHLMEHSLGLLCIHDLDGILLEVNPAVAQTLGYEPQAIVGKNLRAFLAASVQHLLDPYLERLQCHGTARGLIRVVTHTGDERVLSYHNRLIKDTGASPYVLGHAQDITDRVQAQEALRQSEERFRQLVEGSIQGIMIHRAGTPVFANQAYAEIYGYDAPEDILRVENIFQDIIAPEDRARLEHYFQARLRGEPVPTHYICRGVRRDGSYIWVENIVTVVTWWGEMAIQCTVVDISERKRAEEGLHEREERYRTLVEQAADGILISDPDGQYVEVNTSGCAMLGYRREEVLRMRVGDLIPPEDLEREPLNLAALHAGLPVVSERRFRRQDGTLLPVEISAKILSDGHLQSIVRDITARKRAEDALRDSEERFRNLIEGSLQGIIIHRDNQTLFVNQAYVDIFRYETPDELYTLETLLWLIAPHERKRLMDYQDARLAGKAVPSHYEYQGIRKEGSRVWLDTTVRVVSWDGQPAIQSIVADISERKQAEEALRASEDLNRRIVEAVPGGIVQVSHEGSIVRANAEAQRFLGLAYDDLTQRFVTDFASQTIWEDGSPCAMQDYPVSKCLATHQPQPATTIGLRRSDGTIAWAVFTAIPLTDPATDEVTGAVVTFLDITKRKRVETEHQRLEVQLHQMQKMDAIGTLAGGIAHEFNNMLAAILGFTQMASAEVSPASPVSRYLQAVETAGKRAKDLVQQILTFSRPSAHDREPVSFSLVIQETLKLLRASLPTTIEIRQQITPEMGTVLADANQMHQVLMNLCANAEYAMRETGGILEISVDNIKVNDAFAAFHPDLQPGSHVRVRVRDTGAGIPADVVERIFEPFFTTKRIGEGTGMGLAIVHGIITSHSGVITVESTLGAGSTFTIYLPQIAHDMAQAADLPEHVIPRGTGRILFVDDEEMLARLSEGLLERLGYEVVAHTSSLDALETFQAEPHRFDLVITDQTMPAMTGATLVEELRHIRPDIPIILCTGFSHLVNAEKAQELGVDAFVMKPGVTQELAVTIQQVLDKRAQRER